MATVLVSLPIYDIEVYYDVQRNIQIRSNILKLVNPSDSDVFIAVVSGIHKLILEHYLSGLNLLSPEYLEGVKAAVRAPERDFENESVKTHSLAALAGRFSGSEWSETWEEIARTHDRLNAAVDLGK